MRLPATGRPAELSGISIYRFADGKTVESWDEVDFFGLLSQLEAFPQAG
jgi:predicted ester cyclase